MTEFNNDLNEIKEFGLNNNRQARITITSEDVLEPMSAQELLDNLI